MTNTPPVCNYEGSDYQSSFWDRGGREYEDRTEAIALKRLLPRADASFWNLGPARDEIRRATSALTASSCSIIRAPNSNRRRQRLGISDKYFYVAADAYRLPFVDGLFDGATMIRVLHHMADAPKALSRSRT
jgi:hypothetical protein